MWFRSNGCRSGRLAEGGDGVCVVLVSAGHLRSIPPYRNNTPDRLFLVCRTTSISDLLLCKGKGIKIDAARVIPRPWNRAGDVCHLVIFTSRRGPPSPPPFRWCVTSLLNSVTGKDQLQTRAEFTQHADHYDLTFLHEISRKNRENSRENAGNARNTQSHTGFSCSRHLFEFIIWRISTYFSLFFSNFLLFFDKIEQRLGSRLEISSASWFWARPSTLTTFRAERVKFAAFSSRII